MSGQRPPHVQAPAYLTPTTPVPDPAPAQPQPEYGAKEGPEPTRYGDWEKNGIAWDF